MTEKSQDVGGGGSMDLMCSAGGAAGGGGDDSVPEEGGVLHLSPGDYFWSTELRVEY